MAYVLHIIANNLDCFIVILTFKIQAEITLFKLLASDRETVIGDIVTNFESGQIVCHCLANLNQWYQTVGEIKN